MLLIMNENRMNIFCLLGFNLNPFRQTTFCDSLFGFKKDAFCCWKLVFNRTFPLQSPNLEQKAFFLSLVPPHHHWGFGRVFSLRLAVRVSSLLMKIFTNGKEIHPLLCQPLNHHQNETRLL